MRRDDCCRVLCDAILHGSLNFSSLFRSLPPLSIMLHYSPPIHFPSPRPRKERRATSSFSSKRFIGNNNSLLRSSASRDTVFPLPLRWFLSSFLFFFLETNILGTKMMESREKLLSILFFFFLGGNTRRIFASIYSRIRWILRNWISL